MDQLLNSPDTMSFFSNPNFWIAIYGALLSTILAIREFLKGIRKIKVTCNLLHTINPKINKPWQLIEISIINKGYRPVTITSAGLLLNNNDTFFQLENAIGQKTLSSTLPKKINDGDVITIYFDYSTLQEKLNDFNPPVFLKRVIATDAEGKRYTGRLPKALKGKFK